MSTKHYVTFYYPGIMFDEDETRELAERGKVGKVPKGAFGYQEWDREEIERDGEVLRGKPKNHGPMIYFGEVYTVADVERLKPQSDYRVLLSNMRGNGYDRVVRTVRGNWKPLDENVNVLPPPAR